MGAVLKNRAVTAPGGDESPAVQINRSGRPKYAAVVGSRICRPESALELNAARV